MISSAPSCLNSVLKLPLTRAAAACSFARRSSLTPVPIGVMTILLPSRLNDTSLPGATPAARRMCFGIVTWPFSVTNIVDFLVRIRSKNTTATVASTQQNLRFVPALDTTEPSRLLGRVLHSHNFYDARLV